MSDISKISIKGIEYNIKDKTARDFIGNYKSIDEAIRPMVNTVVSEAVSGAVSGAMGEAVKEVENNCIDFINKTLLGGAS